MKRKYFFIILFLIFAIFIFNLIALYNLNFRLEETVEVVDILIENIEKKK
ncbi:unnamed protein product [marine sediment metagenome]|uniref:Uncharacterized protein n=1 Tax=marine sediment metagenome TaxID=412755 RepID=X1K312_9ZZZZ